MKIWCEDPFKTAGRCKELFPERAAHAVGQGDRLLRNEFLFSDHWEMERTHEAVSFPEQIDWACIPAGDEEWLFAMNRHTCLVNLAKAWLFTGKIEYAEKAVGLWQDYLERAPLMEESRRSTWRSLEAGLRCENWLRAMELLEASGVLSRELTAKIEESLRLHAEYLKEASTDFQRLSNWGVLQDHGLFLLGIYFNEPEYICLAAERLDGELHMEIMGDGSQWEQSPMYHCEVLHCALDTVLAAHRAGIDLPERFLGNVEKMCHALAAWLKPDGRLFCQSDSDDTDARDLLALGTLLFEDGRLRAAAGEGIYEENLWDMGLEAEERMTRIASVWPEYASTALPDSGNYVLRGDLTADAAYLHMHNGCLGSGHGHADLLHIDVGACGEDILIDSGRYTYVNTQLRRELKEPAAHNTTRVDGKDFSVCLDSWGYSRLAQPIKGEYRFTEEADYCQGIHLGYFDLPDSVLTERRVVFLKPDIFVIFDLFYAKGSHQVEQNFHFNQGILKREDCNGGRYSWRGKAAQAQIFFLTPGVEITGRKAPYSRDYNLLEEGEALRVSREGVGFQSLITVIGTGEAGAGMSIEAKPVPVSLVRNGRELAPSEAQAVEILRNGQKMTVIAVFADLISEVDFFRAGDAEGYGKMLVFTKKAKDGICLAW